MRLQLKGGCRTVSISKYYHRAEASNVVGRSTEYIRKTEDQAQRIVHRSAEGRCVIQLCFGSLGEETDGWKNTEGDR